MILQIVKTCVESFLLVWTEYSVVCCIAFFLCFRPNVISLEPYG